jgi:enoyl-CoA hydratase/carnithine racemase
MITGSFRKDEFHAKVQEFADAMSRRPPVAVDGIKKAVHQGLETNLRHSLSIELEESARCFSSLSTHKIMKSYNDYIKETIEAPNVKPTTIRDAVIHLESEEFLKSLDV